MDYWLLKTASSTDDRDESKQEKQNSEEIEVRQEKENLKKKPTYMYPWAYLVAQGICLPMQKTQVQSLVQKDPADLRATKPMCHNYCACVPRAHPLEQEKPMQCESPALQLESSPG